MTITELGAFLQARRAAVSPADVGLPDTGRRRVPGLRREEVATLVGVSTDYYVRLEQNRGGRPSESVLNAIAAALNLDGAQRAHLFDLARPGKRLHMPATISGERVGTATLAFLDTLTVPAMVMTRCTQVIAWNPLAAALLADFDEMDDRDRNMARLMFLDEEVVARHRDWESAVRDVVGILRMTAGADPEHANLSALVGELAVRSDVFRRLWAEHHVYEKAHGPKLIRHPDVGDIDLTYATWLIPDAPNQMLITYTTDPRSPSAQALALLGSLAVSAATPDVEMSRDHT
ncbi:helix-turn-helix transcriptional regulator [Williamsia sp.]|uniref:helix-turn-helix transcriptional regulator n=1 Tax=Williamsia sp. TaxID=1872085 RepID=UPI001A1E14C2|nr:helix-turn-helix transcriptional regulator [Williamsia sp.]MBJ7289467.1 helix-turn-helix domain-containing protein [Williamsia sp.]